LRYLAGIWLARLANTCNRDAILTEQIFAKLTSSAIVPPFSPI
jgi:hypothetical protein